MRGPIATQPGLFRPKDAPPSLHKADIRATAHNQRQPQRPLNDQVSHGPAGFRDSLSTLTEVHASRTWT
jgi:hypothetical protein